MQITWRQRILTRFHKDRVWKSAARGSRFFKRAAHPGVAPICISLRLALVSAVALGQNTTAQVPITPAKPASASPAAASPGTTDYSAEPLVIERMEHIYTMAADGTGSNKETIAARVQSDATVRQLGVIGIPFASNTEHVEIGYVRVRRADGTVTETPASQAIEMPAQVTTAAPFYSDLKVMQIPVRNLRAGDKLEWQATIVRTKAEAPNQFWGQEVFTREGVVLSEVVELCVPKGLYVNTWSPAFKPAETTIGDEKILRWEYSQLKPTVGKEAEAEKERKKKQILTADEELDDEQGKLPDVAWSTFKSWDAVGEWYRSLESDRIVPDAEVKTKVAELVKALGDKATEEDKVRAVYAYVATQIHYIGVDFGIGRYQPHHASEVLENQYGDCKDKHTLLAAMLTELGLHPDAVLIGAGIRFNEAVPSPAAFNHLITTFDLNGQQVWLDSTAEVAPYRALQFEIRDKQALVVPETGEPKIERSPAKLPFEAFQKLEADGTLDSSGTANTHMVLTMRGDEELMMRGAFHQISPAQNDEMVQRISQLMGFGGTTSHAEVSRPEDTQLPLKISYDYKKDKPGNDWDNLKIVSQLVPVMLPRVDEKEPPVRSVWLGVPRVEVSTSALKIPEGWHAILPEAIHAKSVYATCDETYRFEKGTIYGERRIEVLQKKVPVADWKSYKKWIDEAKLDNEQFIQLIRTGVKEPGPIVLSKPAAGAGGKAGSGSSPSTEIAVIHLGAPAPVAKNNEAKSNEAKTNEDKSKPAVAVVESTVPSNDEAATLIRSAYQSMQRRDLDQARKQLDDAKAINPEQAWLWAGYGSLEMQRYQLPAAIEDLQKEIGLHPQTYEACGQLAGAQRMFNQKAEANETLRKWAAAQPDNPAPPTALVAMLMEDEDFAKAETEAEAAVARLPEDKKNNERLQMLLGQAQIKAGSKDKGAATLLKLMQSTQDAEMLNDSAYELADAGKDLPLAEAAAKSALSKLEAESKTWTLDEDPQLLAGKSRLIAATWDTLGWALYRDGKVDEAEGYVKAGWLNFQSPDSGKHAGEIAEAKGKKSEALQDYEAALDTRPGYDAMGVRQPPNAVEKEISERIDAISKTKPKLPPMKVHPSPQQLRTIPLGAANGLSGVAEYKLLLSQGKIEKVESAGDKELAGGLERVKQAQFPGYFPPGSEARIVRKGMLNCHANICELVLEP